jgi:hypothetical protein
MLHLLNLYCVAIHKFCFVKVALAATVPRPALPVRLWRFVAGAASAS